MKEIIEKLYVDKNLGVVLGLGVLQFIFTFWLSDYLAAVLPITAFRVTRDVLTVLMVLPIFLLGQKLVSIPKPKPMLVKILFAIGGCMFMTFVSEYYFRWLAVDSSTVATGGYTAAEKSSLYITIKSILVFPFVEEIVFRLAFLGVLSKLTGRFPALLLSSALFAAAHLTRIDPISVAPYFVSGLVFGVTYLLFGLGWASIMHVMGNLLSYAVSEGWYARLIDNNLTFIPFFILVLTGFVVVLRQTIKYRHELIGEREP